MVVVQRAVEVQAEEAGAHVVAAGRRDFRCAGCGYGARCKIAPERCPMCSGSVWNYVGPADRADERDLDATASLSRDD